MADKVKGYIKFNRDSDSFLELIRRRPTAFVLLSLIAQRARRTDKENFDDLKVGEALIGDYENYGVTRQIYRTDKLFLEKFNFATFKSTTKGTVAKLVSKDIFDINSDTLTNALTHSQPTPNQRLTTNKNERMKEEYIPSKEAEELLKFYNHVWGKKLKSYVSFQKNLKFWLASYSMEEIKLALENGKSHRFYGDKLTPEMLLRRRNTRGEDVDRVGELKDYQDPDSGKKNWQYG